MSKEYRPSDCIASCGYPAKTHRTGSGHARDCDAHLRWENNGRTWRPVTAESLYRHTAEARKIVEQLEAITDQFDAAVERDFVLDTARRFFQFGDRTLVSDKQMSWLRGLKEKYL